MEIIRQGRLPGDEEAEVECDRCHTVFKFKRSEGTFRSDQREGDSISIECPYCKQELWIAVSQFN